MWKNKRKLLGIILAATVLLTGCSNEKKEVVERKKTAVIMKSTESAFFKAVYSGANAAGTEYNMEILFEGPENEEDYETQNAMIKQAVEEGYNAIVFSAIDYNACKDAIEKAAKAGVEIIVIDSDVNSDKVTCRIGTDNYEAGKKAAEAVLNCKDDMLNVGIVNFDQNTKNGQERERGFREALKNSERVNRLETINVLSTVSNAREKTKELLVDNPDMNVLVTFNEWTSLGVGYAIEELGVSEKVHVVGFDSNIVSVGMLETGEVDSLIVQNPYAMGYLGVECAYNALNKVPMETEEIDTETILVTRENMFQDECQKALFLFE